MANVLLTMPKLIQKTVANSFYPRQFKAFSMLNVPPHTLPTYTFKSVVWFAIVSIRYVNHYCAFSKLWLTFVWHNTHLSAFCIWFWFAFFCSATVMFLLILNFVIYINLFAAQCYLTNGIVEWCLCRLSLFIH